MGVSNKLRIMAVNSLVFLAIALAAVSVFLAVGIIGLVAPQLIPGGLSSPASSTNVAYGAPSTSPAAAGYANPVEEYVEPASEYETPSVDPAPAYNSEYRRAGSPNSVSYLPIMLRTTPGALI